MPEFRERLEALYGDIATGEWCYPASQYARRSPPRQRQDDEDLDSSESEDKDDDDDEDEDDDDPADDLEPTGDTNDDEKEEAEARRVRIRARRARGEQSQSRSQSSRSQASSSRSRGSSDRRVHRRTGGNSREVLALNSSIREFNRLRVQAPETVVTRAIHRLQSIEFVSELELDERLEFFSRLTQERMADLIVALSEQEVLQWARKQYTKQKDAEQQLLQQRQRLEQQ